MYISDDKPIRVAFYIRVSTEEQKKGYGAEMQLQGLEEAIKYRGKVSNWIHKKEWIYSDLACTGADLNRPQYKQMMEDAVGRKFDMIAVWKIDRLSRNLSHLLSAFEFLQKHKIGFFSQKENIDFTWPIGKLTFQIFGALAEFERETIKMRTKEGKNASARLWNYVLNSTPFGYKKENFEKKRNRSLEIIEQEAQWVKRVFEEFIWGKSREQISKMLNEAKVRKGEGGMKQDKTSKWYGTSIDSILKNPVYTGRAVYKSKDEKWQIEEIVIPTPRIISDMTFELAQAQIVALEENIKCGGGFNKYLLSRKIIDVETGRIFVWVNRTKDNKTSYRRKWFVFEGKKYPNREIPWDVLEEMVWKTVFQRVNRPQELFDIYVKQSIDTLEYEALAKEREVNQRIIEQLTAKEERIYNDYYEWRIADTICDKLVNNAIEWRAIAESRNEELDKKMDDIIKMEQTKNSFKDFEQDFNANIDNLSFEQKKSLVDFLVESIEVTTVASQINAKVNIRFGQPTIEQNEAVYEPKKSSPMPQTGSEELDSSHFGAIGGTRTHDLLLRREAL